MRGHNNWSNLKDKMRQNGIYLLEDTSDRDFERFVFVDPIEEKNRVPFLKELFNVLNPKQNGKTNFADEKHREELKSWIGSKDVNDNDVNPYNWLKITIERFPNRLFVVRKDKRKDKWINAKKIPTFLKKRICFIEDCSKLKDQLDGSNFEQFIMNLFCSWLNHILLDVRNIRTANFLNIYYGPGEGPIYIQPDTVPRGLRASNKTGYKNGSKNCVSICLKNANIDHSDYIKDYIKKEGIYILFLTKHQGIYYYDDKNNKWKTCFDDVLKRTIFSEGLSGAMSYFQQIYSARATLDSFASKLFILKYVENALLRIGICDERFQEWWLSKERKYRGYLYQARLIPVYLENEKKYGQKAFPKDCGFYGVIKKNKTFGLNIYQPENAGKLWPKKQRYIDLLIIHQGILEKWAGGDESSTAITNRILDLKEQIPFIIVTSGRGRPDNVPNGVKFLPFSNLESCMIGNYFERLTLLRQIMNISEQI